MPRVLKATIRSGIADQGKAPPGHAAAFEQVIRAPRLQTTKPSDSGHLKQCRYVWAARVSNPARRIKSRAGGRSPICLLSSQNGSDLRIQVHRHRPSSAVLCRPVRLVVDGA